MTKIEAIIQPYKFHEVMNALIEIGIDGMTVTEVMGSGRHEKHMESHRGRYGETHLVPKVKLEIVIPDCEAQDVSATICRNARTGRVGDGNIFTFRVGEALRIRNGQYNEAAL